MVRRLATGQRGSICVLKYRQNIFKQSEVKPEKPHSRILTIQPRLQPDTSAIQGVTATLACSFTQKWSRRKQRWPILEYYPRICLEVSKKNNEPTIRLFSDDCVIYRKIINKEDIEKLQKDLDRLGEWAVENAMKINPSKSKAVRFTRARVKIHQIIHQRIH